MTHEYTILTGGTVIVGGDAPDARAIAWAHDTSHARSRSSAAAASLRGACAT